MLSRVSIAATVAALPAAYAGGRVHPTFSKTLTLSSKAAAKQGDDSFNQLQQDAELQDRQLADQDGLGNGQGNFLNEPREVIRLRPERPGQGGQGGQGGGSAQSRSGEGQVHGHCETGNPANHYWMMIVHPSPGTPHIDGSGNPATDYTIWSTCSPGGEHYLEVPSDYVVATGGSPKYTVLFSEIPFGPPDATTGAAYVQTAGPTEWPAAANAGGWPTSADNVAFQAGTLDCVANPSDFYCQHAGALPFAESPATTTAFATKATYGQVAPNQCTAIQTGAAGQSGYNFCQHPGLQATVTNPDSGPGPISRFNTYWNYNAVAAGNPY